MIRSSSLNPFLNFLSQILRAAPVLYYEKGHMERVREIKKTDPTIFYLPPFADRFKCSYYLLSALLARSFT